MARTLKMVKHLVLPFDQKAQIWDPWRQLWNNCKDTNKLTLHNAFEDDSFNQGLFTTHPFVLDCK